MQISEAYRASSDVNGHGENWAEKLVEESALGAFHQAAAVLPGRWLEKRIQERGALRRKV